MVEIINLRMARKRKARAEAEALAARNRAAFGRSARDKEAAQADAERRERTLDGAKREE